MKHYTSITLQVFEESKFFSFKSDRSSCNDLIFFFCRVCSVRNRLIVLSFFLQASFSNRTYFFNPLGVISSNILSEISPGYLIFLSGVVGVTGISTDEGEVTMSFRDCIGALLQRKQIQYTDQS